MSYLSYPFITLSGSTGGNSVGESVELEPALVLSNGSGYTVRIQCIASGSVSGVEVTQGFIQTFSVRRDSNVTIIAGQDTQDQFGDAAASSWTLTVSVGTGPDRFKIVFTTGSTTAATLVYCDVFVTQNVTPAGYTQSPFKTITDLYFDPVSNLVWVADQGQTTSIIPVLNAHDGSVNTVITVPPAAGWATYSANAGAKAFAADANYVYATNAYGSETIVVISKSTLQVVGYLNPTWSSVTYGAIAIDSMVATGGYLYVAVSNASFSPHSGANILQFNVANAIASFPTAVTPVAANTDIYVNGGSNLTFNVRYICYDGTYLWAASVDNETSGIAADYEYLYSFNPSTLATVSSTQYTSANTDPYSTDLLYAFGNVLWANAGNPFSPYQTFNGSTAQVFSNGSGYITLPNHGGVVSMNADTADNTLLILSGSSIYRYNTTPSLASTITPSFSGGPSRGIMTTSSYGIWIAGYNIPLPATWSIQVYTTTVGSEALSYTITGF